ncbi:hypothetical protein [Halomontanus rarus]|uniref:hypothetical protein n=1 Tax=Halomontanus rarus TaxID=3034020 RepID=UPI0023E8101C|nr:hypothetical protein [Halovivax sp. TS33]
MPRSNDPSNSVSPVREARVETYEQLHVIAFEGASFDPVRYGGLLVCATLVLELHAEGIHAVHE